MWFAVDMAGGMLFGRKPIRDHGHKYWMPHMCDPLLVLKNKVDWPNPDQTWENEPIEVKLVEVGDV